MYAINALNLNKIIALCILILITFVLLNMWNINLWQQSLLKKITKEPAVKSLLKVSKEKSLVLAQVNLPAVPKQPMTKAPQSSKTSTPIVNKINQQSSTEKQANSAKDIQKKASKQHVSKSSASAIYQQLISDSSLDIELAWPNEISARQDVFTFLYQCIGMKFGVLNNQKVSLVRIPSRNTRFNEKQQPSEWLRIAQGKLAKQELRWLQQYNLSGTPVRLFPKMVDWQLAKHINNQLNGKPLKSLRAHYKRDNQHLILTGIKLNGQLLNNNWKLIENKCDSSK